MAKNIRNGLTQKQRKTRNKRWVNAWDMYFVRQNHTMKRNWKAFPYGAENLPLKPLKGDDPDETSEQ